VSERFRQHTQIGCGAAKTTLLRGQWKSQPALLGEVAPVIRVHAPLTDDRLLAVGEAIAFQHESLDAILQQPLLFR